MGAGGTGASGRTHPPACNLSDAPVDMPLVRSAEEQATSNADEKEQTASSARKEGFHRKESARRVRKTEGA